MTAHLSLGLSGSLDSVEFLYSPDPGDSFMAAPLERRVAPNKLFCCTEAKFELQKFSHENNLTSLQNFQPLFRFFFLSSQIESKQTSQGEQKGWNVRETRGENFTAAFRSSEAVFGSSVSILHLLSLLFLNDSISDAGVR